MKDSHSEGKRLGGGHGGDLESRMAWGLLSHGSSAKGSMIHPRAKKGGRRGGLYSCSASADVIPTATSESRSRYPRHLSHHRNAITRNRTNWASNVGLPRQPWRGILHNRDRLWGTGWGQARRLPFPTSNFWMWSSHRQHCLFGRLPQLAKQQPRGVIFLRVSALSSSSHFSIYTPVHLP